MSDLIFNLYINILAAVLISIGAFFFRPISSYLAIKKKHGLVGEWFAAIAPNSPNMHEIVIQKVTIEHKLKIVELFMRSFGLLDLKCVQCLLGYAWEGTASISSGRFLIGEWWSTKEGAHQRGTFTLTISSQGDIFYGYVSGFNDEDKIVMKKWVFGKTK